MQILPACLLFSLSILTLNNYNNNYYLFNNQNYVMEEPKNENEREKEKLEILDINHNTISNSQVYHSDNNTDEVYFKIGTPKFIKRNSHVGIIYGIYYI